MPRETHPVNPPASPPFPRASPTQRTPHPGTGTHALNRQPDAQRNHHLTHTLPAPDTKPP
ncbi:hypothetical protein GCM10027445_09020 [Amycolatopsis endophytica]